MRKEGGGLISETIRALRESRSWTQAELAKRLGITRSSVNAWEMGISVPSTQYIVELAGLFKVSTDYLLGLGSSATISLDGLTESDIQVLHHLVTHLKNKNSGLEQP